MSDAVPAALQRMRRELEATDRKLLDLVAARSEQVRAIWSWKRERGLALYDPVREDRIVERWLARGRAAGLETGALLHLFYALLEATAPASAAGDFVRLHRPGSLPDGAPPGQVAGTGARQQRHWPEQPEPQNNHDPADNGPSRVNTTGLRES